jgi:hypothetical protein
MGVREEKEDEERKKREKGKPCVRWGKGLGVRACSGGEERRAEKEEKEKKEEEGERCAGCACVRWGIGLGEGEESRRKERERKKGKREGVGDHLFSVCGGDVSAKRSIKS